MKGEPSQRKIAKRRAPNITPELSESVIQIIENWNGAITWKRIIEAIERTHKITYTRQTLSKHSAISTAFKAYSTPNDLKRNEGRRKSSTPELQMIQDELDAEKVKVALLKEQNRFLLEQFVRWAYNASQRGLTEAYLNQQLPQIRNSQSLEKKRGK